MAFITNVLALIAQILISALLLDKVVFASVLLQTAGADFIVPTLLPLLLLTSCTTLQPSKVFVFASSGPLFDAHCKLLSQFLQSCCT